MPENAEKLPKPRIGGTSIPARPPARAASSGRIAPSRWRWRWAFGRVREIAHRRDHGISSRAAADRARRAPKRGVHGRRTARKLRTFYGSVNRPLTRAPGRDAGTRTGRQSWRDEFELRELSLDRRSFLRRGAVGGAGAGVARDGRHVGVARRVRELVEAGSSSTTPTTPAARPKDLGELDVPAVVDQERRVRGRVHRRHERLLQGRRASRRSTCSPVARTCSRTRSSRRARRSSCISAPDITSAGDQQRRRPHHDRRAVPEEPVRGHEPGEQARSRRRRT